MTVRIATRLAGAVLAGFAGTFGTVGARAAGLCDCCASSLTPSCETACKPVTLAPAQCPAIVDYEGSGDTVSGKNPLNGRSLKDIMLGDPSRQQLEAFRIFLENSRRDAVWVYVKALKAFRQTKITEEELATAKALNEEALVNYYHGMNAYLTAVGTKAD
jgi:hypothetical protein